MSKIYLHFSDKTLILDSSENLLYPLQGSLLTWRHLRVAFALSLTQSLTDDNAGYSTTESLPIVSTLPILNHVAIGLKNRNTSLPGEDGCHFAGITNHSASNGSSLGTVSSVITLCTKKAIAFPLTLTAPGVSGYNVTSTPLSVPLATPYDDQGTFFDLPAGQSIVFNGKTVQLASSVTDGATSLSLTASPSVSLTNSDVIGSASTTQVDPSSSLGYVNNTSYSTTSTTNASQCLSFPASFVMQGATNYATILVLDYVIANKGLGSQTLTMGYQVLTNQGDTSVAAMEAAIAAYSPTYANPSALSYASMTPPNCIFIRWPFATSRLRVHSIVAKRV